MPENDRQLNLHYILYFTHRFLKRKKYSSINLVFKINSTSKINQKEENIAKFLLYPTFYKLPKVVEFYIKIEREKKINLPLSYHWIHEHVYLLAAQKIIFLQLFISRCHKLDKVKVGKGARFIFFLTPNIFFFFF